MARVKMLISPSVALGDTVNGEKEDEEALRAHEVGIQVLAQSPAAIQMEEEGGIGLAQGNNDES